MRVLDLDLCTSFSSGSMSMTLVKWSEQTRAVSSPEILCRSLLIQANSK